MEKEQISIYKDTLKEFMNVDLKVLRYLSGVIDDFSVHITIEGADKELFDKLETADKLIDIAIEHHNEFLKELDT